MERIRFERQEYRQADRTSGVRILIDGRDLGDLVRDAEMPFAAKEGALSIAGAYAGLPPDDVVPPSGHFLGEPSSALYRYGERTQVLGCDCGEPGCWPLICHIAVTESTVLWSQFEQPHRNGSGAAAAWNYDTFGPFEFDRRQYEAALREIAAAG